MDLPKKSDDTNQVLEYYKKFSQNPDLSKYFSGPEAALVKKSTVSTGCPKESPEICITNNPSFFTHVEVDITSNIELPISCEMNQEEEENKNISPSSSIASNKKLEWDNGADIGYSNSYKLSTRKSASFPSLFTNELSVKSSKFINQSGEKPTSENVKEMRNMYHQLTFSTETSSSPSVEHVIPSSSSTSTPPKELSASNTSQNEHIVKRFSSSSSGTSDKQIPYFQRRIGKPVANSTPYEELSSKSSEHENNKDTPVLRVQSKPKRNLNKNSEDSSESERILGAGKNREKSNSSKSSDLVCQKSLLNPENPFTSIKNLGTSEGVQKLSKVQREINLCLTKPVFLECMSSVTKECLNKVSQTTFGLDKTSKAMQTDMFEFEKKIIHAPPPCVCTPLIQKVEFIHFKNGEICSPNETKPGFNHSRQQSLEVSNASSLKNEEKEMNNIFEDMKMNTKMVRGNSYKKPETSTESEVSEKNHTNVVDLKNRDLQRNKYFEKNKKIENIKNEKSVKEVGNSLYNKDENNSESISASNSESSHLKNINGESKFDTIHDSCSDEMILAEMISLNHSRDLNTDIKRSIDILQKLLKSKKYDQSTKKYYIKKIVQKIVESKYSDDSTTSSEFFRPKKTQSGRENTQRKEAMETYMPKNKLRDAQSEVKLMDNVPWFPVLQTKNISPRKKNKKLDGKNAKSGMGTNIRNSENRSKPVAKDDHDLVRGKNFKSTPDFNLLEKQQMKNFGNDVKMTSSSPHDIQFSDGLIHTKPQGAKYRPTSCDYKINDKNWKGVKTLSERLIENRDKVVSKIGQGDYLLHVATTERQHQLSWINNEIEHLVKLKDLLEKKKKKPEPQMNEVISSLLKMKVDDMKGLTKNCEVFICKCSATKGRCECTCEPKKSSANGKSKKKSASLTPGYYTIETQLDPDGNLLDLTVFDEKGTKKYNYRNDGAVDDVLVTSANHNTAVKLKPKAEDYLGRLVPGPYRLCKACGKLFLPPVNNPESCLCQECFEADPEPASNRFISKNNYKVCKSCGKLFLPSKKHPDLCICEECFEQEPEQEDQETDYSPYKVCKACGKLFLPSVENPDSCLCEKCCRRFPEHESKPQHKICKDCGKYFIPPKDNQQQSMCDECLDEVPPPELRCACQRVTFSEPLELHVCRCVGKDLPKQNSPGQNRSQCTRLKTPTTSTTTKKSHTNQKSHSVSSKNYPGSKICPSCGRPLNKCICGLKFVPKEPILVGKGSYEEIDDEDLLRCFERTKDKDKVCKPCPAAPPIRKLSCACKKDSLQLGKGEVEVECSCGKDSQPTPGPSSPRTSCVKKERRRTSVSFDDEDQIVEESDRRPCTHCAGVQANLPSSPLPRSSPPRSRSSSSELKRSRGHPCTHCASVQATLPSTPRSRSSTPPPRPRSASARSRSRVPCPSIQKNELRVRVSSPNISQPKHSCLCKDGTPQYKPSNKGAGSSEPYIPCPSTSSKSSSSREPSQQRRVSRTVSQPQAKQDICCEACKSCKSSPLPSPEPSETVQKCKKTCTGYSLEPPKKENFPDKCSPKCKGNNNKQVKKSCQCCTCTNCAVQTKRLGDKNARCQCCICENCGIQVTLDRFGKPRKPIISKWCQPKKSNMQTAKGRKSKTVCIKPQKIENKTDAQCKCNNDSDKDELDCTDDSLQSISSGNIICITPTKYKYRNKEKSSSECQCTMAKSNSGNNPENHKCMQICPSILKAICKSISATSTTQDRQSSRDTCSPCCFQPTPVDISPPMQEGQSSSKKSGSLSSSLREIPSNDEAPSLSANSHHVQSPKGDTRASVTRNQRNMQLYMFTTQNPMIASEISRSDTCKCNQTATHEEKDIQCPASKQCTCQTEPKEDVKIQCSCKADAGVTCKCGETACQCQNENVCECKKSESSSSSGSSSSSDTLISCVCCKKEKVLKNLMNKLPLCDPCQQVHQKCFYPYKYSNPLHSCMCYSLLDQDTLCELKSTLTELERLDIYQQYCEVLKNCKCCKTCGCKCKLPKKFKNGCAYFLKLEDACPNKHCEEEEQGEFDYEQCCEGEEEEEEEEEKYLPQVTVKVPNCKGACSRKKKNENKDGTKKQISCPSIQTYLCAMRPEFVERAERRRRILRLATLQREEDLEKRKLKYVDKVNYLNHLNQPVSSEANMCGTYGHQAKTYCFVDVALDDSPKRVRPRVFRSFREMKDLTRRKYLHLSEVRSKKDIHKEKRLREANRILANTFTRRLQKSTLRGNVDIPHNVRVVSY